MSGVADVRKRPEAVIDKNFIFALWVRLGSIRFVHTRLITEEIINPIKQKPYSVMTIYNYAKESDFHKEFWAKRENLPLDKCVPTTEEQLFYKKYIEEHIEIEREKSKSGKSIDSLRK